MCAPREVVSLHDSPDPEIIHIIADDREALWDDVIWVMLCGVSCIALDDGTLIPALNFYGIPVGDKATCVECRERWLRGEGIPADGKVHPRDSSRETP